MVNRRTITQYKGICKEIIASKRTSLPLLQPNNLKTMENSVMGNTNLQIDKINETVIQKIQLHYSYDNNKKCLEIYNGKKDVFNSVSINDDKQKMENNIKIIIKIKIINPPKIISIPIL